jgi:hypothetical protein
MTDSIKQFREKAGLYYIHVKTIAKLKNTSEGQHVFIKKPRRNALKQNIFPKNMKSMRENG